MRILFFMVFAVALLACQTSFAVSHHQLKKRHHGIHKMIKAKSTALVDFNHAIVSDLVSLKGIGLKKATAIVNYRKKHGDFKKLSDLSKVNGIGLKTISAWKVKNPGRLVVNSTENLG